MARKTMNAMAETELELVFALSEGEQDVFKLTDAVFEAGCEDSIVGTGVPGMIEVTLEAVTDQAEDAVHDAAHVIQKQLPTGSVLREVRPDLVRLAEVVKRPDVTHDPINHLCRTARKN